MKLRVIFLVLSLISFSFVSDSWTAQPDWEGSRDSSFTSECNDNPADLTELSLEELMNLEVTSVSKKPEKLSQAAAAIYVLTNEDVRRSGFTTIADALRIVPGVHVARINANKWAVSSRGFNDMYANKMLVLIDGRSVYTPLFGGVHWDIQDIIMEDLERIEVIRGPGATLWGANAVNGVINIITKHAKDTQGGVINVGLGSEERGFGSCRFGGTLADDTFYRVYAKYINHDNSIYQSGEPAADSWDLLHGGFQVNWDPTSYNSFTFKADAYKGDINLTTAISSLTPPYSQVIDDEDDAAGGNILARWSHVFSVDANMELQVYYDQTERNISTLGELRRTLDIDFQYLFNLGSFHEIVWGLGYRYSHDNLKNTFTFSFSPESRGDNLFSSFLQDEIGIIRDRLHLIGGTKLEHNDYSGFEIQPNIRLLVTPNQRHTVWVAISRAIRMPTRVDHNITGNIDVIPPYTGPNQSPYPLLISFRGSEDFKSEILNAYESGYRVQAADGLNLDIAAFYNEYDKLSKYEAGSLFLESSQPPEYLVTPLYMTNNLDGENYGVEVTVDWSGLKNWRLCAAYTFREIQLNSDQTSQPSQFGLGAVASAQNQVVFRSSVFLPGDLGLDLGMRYVDGIPSLDVRSYITLDARLAWRPFENLEFSIVGRDLTESHHHEFSPRSFYAALTEVERGAYGAISWRF